MKHLPHAFFDHYPILIDFGDNKRDRLTRDKGRFRFNAKWIIKESCEEQVRNFSEENSSEILIKLEKLEAILKNEMRRIYVGRRRM